MFGRLKNKISSIFTNKNTTKSGWTGIPEKSSESNCYDREKIKRWDNTLTLQFNKYQNECKSYEYLLSDDNGLDIPREKKGILHREWQTAYNNLCMANYHLKSNQKNASTNFQGVSVEPANPNEMETSV